MKIVVYITRQKRPVELKRNNPMIKKFTQNEHGGGLGIVFIGLAIILLVLIVFINIADYGVFTYKRNSISKAMDYAVTAAVQEVNKENSRVGLSNGFSDSTGKNTLEHVEINIDTATQKFLTILKENYRVEEPGVEEHLLVCTTTTLDNKLNYKIKVNRDIVAEGLVDNPSQIQEEINQAIEAVWPDSENKTHVFINANPKTNLLENGTYLFAFMANIKITGVNSQRNISLSSLAGAKLER